VPRRGCGARRKEAPCTCHLAQHTATQKSEISFVLEFPPVLTRVKRPFRLLRRHPPNQNFLVLGIEFIEIWIRIWSWIVANEPECRCVNLNCFQAGANPLVWTGTRRRANWFDCAIESRESQSIQSVCHRVGPAEWPELPVPRCSFRFWFDGEGGLAFDASGIRYRWPWMTFRSWQTTITKQPVLMAKWNRNRSIETVWFFENVFELR